MQLSTADIRYISDDDRSLRNYIFVLPAARKRCVTQEGEPSSPWSSKRCLAELAGRRRDQRTAKLAPKRRTFYPCPSLSAVSLGRLAWYNRPSSASICRAALSSAPPLRAALIRATRSPFAEKRASDRCLSAWHRVSALSPPTGALVRLCQSVDLATPSHKANRGQRGGI